MKKSAKVRILLVAGLICLTPMVAAAYGQRGQGGQGRPQGPPPEAIEACQDKSVGDSVEFKGRRGESIEATCQERDGQLAAVPDNPPEGGAPR